MSESAHNQSDKQRRWQLYTDHIKQAWEDIQSSTDSFDQALLAVSSGALGLSLAFIKDIVPLATAVRLNLLFASWLLFGICIVLTVFSFLLSIKAQRVHLDYLEQYYLKYQDEYLTKKSWHSELLAWFTRGAAASFFAGLVCIVLFCVINVSRSATGAAKMTEPNDVVLRRLTEDGRQPINVTPAPTGGEERGRQPVAVTPAPSAPKPAENTSGNIQGDSSGKK